MAILRRNLTSASRTRLPEQGFSLVEVLVVMGIIAVLAGGALLVVGLMLESRRELETRSTVARAALLVEDWERTFDRYPPSTLAQMEAFAGEPGLDLTPPNETNDGVETVYQSLLRSDFEGIPGWQAEQVGNTDADRLRRPLHGAGTEALLEVVDGYGQPLVYFRNGDYARYAEAGAAYVARGSEVKARPHRAADGTFLCPLSFQVFSIGPDGVPNTADDVGHWEL